MADRKIIHENKSPDKTYVSKAFPQTKWITDGNGGAVEAFDYNIRVVSKVIDSPEQYSYVRLKDEVVLRKTGKGRQEIKAKVVEDSKGIQVLTIQRFTNPSGMPHEASFSFLGEEIGTLYDFIGGIIELQFHSDGSYSYYDRKSPSENISLDGAKEVVLQNDELLREIIYNGVTKEDLVTIGYRKKQLEIFSKLLNEPSYFEDLKVKYKTTNEGLWQRFFEKNNWIFGFGLNYVFNSNLDGAKLEQVVQGANFNSSGKRIDALMKTRGIIESFSFVEIKTHKTNLLKALNSPYRSESWQVSDELSGAIAQVQRTVQKAITQIKDKVNIKDLNGNPTGEKVYLYNPKSYIVIGSLSEFESDFGINEDKYSSFELFRQGLSKIDIITYDELYERAKNIVKMGENVFNGNII
ncbi:Shedu immune nuclease family protein [Sphingobacterium multivorum]|uniref:Shedu immune nuclease family protein n=1 Tax=Sphingobacterium multivorum TaxID=28454 RepID=UPI0028B0F9E5|nr:Shedu immune nuclease family protein [Sphingobacterium multivorum]